MRVTKPDGVKDGEATVLSSASRTVTALCLDGGSWDVALRTSAAKPQAASHLRRSELSPGTDSVEVVEAGESPEANTSRPAQSPAEHSNCVGAAQDCFTQVHHFPVSPISLCHGGFFLLFKATHTSSTAHGFWELTRSWSFADATGCRIGELLPFLLQKRPDLVSSDGATHAAGTGSLQRRPGNHHDACNLQPPLLEARAQQFPA